jgi:hypothetical protein
MPALCNNSSVECHSKANPTCIWPAALVQVLRILSSETGKGGFFPEGVNGKINSPVGFNVAANAYGGYPGNQVRK